MSRKVTVYSTVGKKSLELQVEGNDWGSLKQVLTGNEVKYSGMKAVIGESRLTLESPNAMLPEGDFTLFLMPVKTKSGITERKELMNKIAVLRAKDPKGVKEHFTVEGRNVTQIKTDDLKKLYASYKPAGKSSEATSKVVKEAAKEAKKKVKPAATSPKPESVYKGMTEEMKAYLTESLADLSVLKVGSEVGKGTVNLISEMKTVVDGGQDTLVKLIAEKEEAERKAKEEEERKAAEKRNKELDNAAHDIAKDFSDIRSW